MLKWPFCSQKVTIAAWGRTSKTFDRNPSTSLSCHPIPPSQGTLDTLSLSLPVLRGKATHPHNRGRHLGVSALWGSPKWSPCSLAFLHCPLYAWVVILFSLKCVVIASSLKTELSVRPLLHPHWNSRSCSLHSLKHGRAACAFCSHSPPPRFFSDFPQLWLPCPVISTLYCTFPRQIKLITSPVSPSLFYF